MQIFSRAGARVRAAPRLITYLAIYAGLLIAYVGVIVYLATKAARGEDLSPQGMSHSGKAQVEAITPAE